uniref:Uncharacterized protein n=1 Tax=Octopus bimaculoides TaxID=37653 RepID=A0A0L8GEK6_OCTBM
MFSYFLSLKTFVFFWALFPLCLVPRPQRINCENNSTEICCEIKKISVIEDTLEITIFQTTLIEVTTILLAMVIRETCSRKRKVKHVGKVCYERQRFCL